MPIAFIALADVTRSGEVMPKKSGDAIRELSPGPVEPESLVARFLATRRATVRLCEPLAVEDHGLQAMPECSPPKWHLARTTWFFETFVLADHETGFRPHHPLFRVLFNSYYE